MGTDAAVYSAAAQPPGSKSLNRSQRRGSVVERHDDGKIVLCSSHRRLVDSLARFRASVPYLHHVEPPSGNAPSRRAVLDGFPLVRKADLLSLGRSAFQSGIGPDVVISETSGTTSGNPLVTPRSAEELRWNSRNLSKAFEVSLNSYVDRVGILHPAIMSPFAEACGLALTQIGVPFVRVYPIPKVCDYKRLVRILRDYEISAIMTTPALARKLLYERSRLSKEDRKWSLRQFLLTGELVTEASLSNIARLFDGEGRAFVYGSSEAATVAIPQNHFRFRPCLGDFVFELHPTEGPEPIYEIVLTWLNGGARPLIRYATGDATFFGGEDHDPWLEILGRIEAPFGDVLTRQRVDRAVYDAGPAVYHFVAERRDQHLKVEVICSSDLTDRDTASAREALTRSIGGVWQGKLEVVVNPPEHSFRDFSPSPKMAQFLKH